MPPEDSGEDGELIEEASVAAKENEQALQVIIGQAEALATSLPPGQFSFNYVYLKTKQ